MKLPAVQEVLDYITDHLAPKDLERHKYGEVFTPLTLVDEMLATLPTEVWAKKDWKWLDPANGIGNFPIKALLGQNEGAHTYPGLMHGLEKEIPDAGRRCKHIVENMLFMVDINPKNNAIARRLFEKLCPGARANIDQIDRKDGFLSAKPLMFNGKEVAGFDVIMGNPPYQGGAIKAVATDKTRKRREVEAIDVSKNKNLWVPFVDKSLHILKSEGYLLLIHPIGWFKTEGDKQLVSIHNKMLEHYIILLKIYEGGQLLDTFGAAGKIRSAYYLLQKEVPIGTTQIIDVNGNDENVKLNKKHAIVTAHNSIFTKIQQKCKLWKDTDDYRQMSLNISKCKKGGKYNNIKKITEDGKIIILQTDEKHPLFETPKLFIDGYTYPRFFYDKDGAFGVIDQNQHYLIGKDLDKQVAYFKTKLSALILKYVKYRQEFIEPRYYPDVRELELETINDDTLADYFGFTQTERRYIQSSHYPNKEFKLHVSECKQAGGYRHKTRKLRR